MVRRIGVWVDGVGVEGIGFTVYGSGKSFGSRVEGRGCRGQGIGRTVQGVGCREEC